MRYIALSAALSFGALAMAADPMAGTWKFDASNSSLGFKPQLTISRQSDELTLKRNTGATLTGSLDGKERTVTQPSTFDTVSFRQVDARRPPL